jgi:hypothetical protein
MNTNGNFSKKTTSESSTESDKKNKKFIIKGIIRDMNLLQA